MIIVKTTEISFEKGYYKNKEYKISVETSLEEFVKEIQDQQSSNCFYKVDDDNFININQITSIKKVATIPSSVMGVEAIKMKN